MPDIEGPYIVTPTNPDDKKLGDVMSAIVNDVVGKHRQSIIDAVVLELLYGELPDA